MMRCSWLFSASRHNERFASSKSGCLGFAASSQRWIFSLALLLGALLLGGCTIFYEPTFEPSDGGTDGMTDGLVDGAQDAGPDAIRTELNCEDGDDNDNDGLVDCNDYDCSYLEACCQSASGSVEVLESWKRSEGFTRWSATGDAPVIDVEGTLSFSGGLGTLLWNECIVTDLGLFGRIRFKPQLDTPDNCEDDVATLGFTVASNPGSDGQFASEIRVTVNACGRYDVFRGNTLLTPTGHRPADPDQTVNFALTPSTEGEQDVMRATISAVGLSGPPTTLVEGVAFMTRNEMLNPGLCGDRGRGLRLYLEGQAARNAMEVGQVRFTTAQCANPSQFSAAEVSGSAQFDVRDVNPSETNPSAAWASGGFGSPSLAVDGANLLLLYDATPDPRQIADFHPIDFAIGRSAAAANEPEMPWTPSSAGEPISDPLDAPESCQDVNCVSELKYRDPFVFDDLVAYTQEREGQPEIVMQAGYEHFLNLSPAVPMLTAKDTAWVDETPVCPDGVSQPTFAELPFNQRVRQFWLFFTCHSGDARNIGYQRVSLEDTSFVLSGTGGLVRVVQKGGHAGSYAVGGSESPEIIVESGQEPNVIYRLWFIARDRGQRRSVALAQWQPQDPQELPDFIPFPGNPVLQSGDPEAMCGSGCKLESLAVARDEDRLRFLLAQSVNAFAGVNYRIVSLIQNWSRPQWPN